MRMHGYPAPDRATAAARDEAVAAGLWQVSEQLTAYLQHPGRGVGQLVNRLQRPLTHPATMTLAA